MAKAVICSEPFTLRCHPRAAAAWVSSLGVGVRFRSESSLHLSFRLDGDLSRARIPAPLEPERVDGLWCHTCFEVFVGRQDRSDYLEYNLAPSGRWQAYGFSGYRQSRRLLEAECPAIECVVTRRALSLRATVHLPEIAGPWEPRLGLCAVLEDTDGGLSYWALQHPKTAPDFHDPRAFVLLSAFPRDGI